MDLVRQRLARRVGAFITVALVLGLATLLLGIGVSLPGLTPGTAAAASVDLRGDRLEISGDANADWLAVNRREGQFIIRAVRESVTLTTKSADCDAAIPAAFARVRCPATGVELIDASMGSGNDYFLVKSGTLLPGPGSFDDRFGCYRRIDLGATLKVSTGDGRDFAELSNRRDLLRGGADRDHLYGCKGGDRIKGGAGPDLLSGDWDDDLLVGGRGRDLIVGCRYNPVDPRLLLSEAAGGDELRGGSGPDSLTGCQGVDDYRAGDGPDRLKTRDRLGEKVHCGGGNDVVVKSDPEDRLTVCEEQPAYRPFQP